MLLSLARAWAGSSLRTEVVSLQGEGSIGPLLRAAGTVVRPVGMRRNIPSLSSLRRLRREIGAGSPEVVQGWMYHGNLAALGGVRMNNNPTPVVWNIRHSIYDLADEKWLTHAVIRIGALLSGRAARILYNSRTSASQHAAIGFAAERAVVVPNGYDTTEFRPDADARATWRLRLGAKGATPLVGLIGRWHPMKDHANFLRAAAFVRARLPTSEFVLAGRGVDGTNLELAALLSESGLSAGMSVLGEVADVAGLTAALDVACSSSYSEAFPNVLAEGLACGVPVVATDVGDSRWIVGDAGEIVPPRDPSRLGSAIVRLLNLKFEERAELGAKGRQRVTSLFSLAEIASRYRSIYAEVADEVRTS